MLPESNFASSTMLGASICFGPHEMIIFCKIEIFTEIVAHAQVTQFYPVSCCFSVF